MVQPPDGIIRFFGRRNVKYMKCMTLQLLPEARMELE